MTKRLTKLVNAFSRCKLAYEKNPLLFPFEAIMHQLKYLIDLEEKKTKDIEPLKKIKIGWIAVRELDGYEDQELINLLCSISHETENMFSQRDNENER